MPASPRAKRGPSRSSAAPSRSKGTARKTLLETYRLALVARAVDERLWILSRQGRVSFVLTARGHEVAQIASALALRVGIDSAWLYYRDLAVAITLGVTPLEIFLGALGRASDPHSGGRQLTAHFSSPRLRIGSVSSAVAAHLPQAVGAAYAATVLGNESVAVCWFGDGATSEGDAHEAFNWAGVHKLPVVFVCENNGYAISTPARLQFPVGSLAERAKGYGMPGIRVDGTDTLAVHRASVAAVRRARRGDGPSFIEAIVPRMTPHSSQDDDAYRRPRERKLAVQADPVRRLRADMVRAGVLSEAEDEQLRRAIQQEVSADEDRALAEPEPDPARARQWLYAGDPAHEYLAELEKTAP